MSARDALRMHVTVSSPSALIFRVLPPFLMRSPPFFCGHHYGYRVRSYCAGWKTQTPHKGNARITYCDYGEAPTRQLHSNTHCCLWSGHSRKRSNSLASSSISNKVGTRCRSPSYERFLEGCSPPFTQLTEHLTALRAWCKKYLPS